MSEPVFTFVRLITQEESERVRRMRMLGMVVDDHSAVRELDERWAQRRARMATAMVFGLGFVLGGAAAALACAALIK